MQYRPYLAGDSIEFDFDSIEEEASDTQEVTVHSCTLSELLSGEFGILTIPEYQRPYIWATEEIDKLFTDLVDYFGEKDSDKPLYYLGSIILHRSGRKLNIIDGQQRITTLAILQNILDSNQTPIIEYVSPTSIDNIKRNYLHLKKKNTEMVDLSAINVTLIITPSEDEAYTFFETQNTGGVKLGGVDIIKAHHLRAFEFEHERSQYARIWEAQKDLDKVVNLLLKARHWGVLNWQEVPSYRELKAIKNVIINEFSEKTIQSNQNFGFQLVKFNNSKGDMNMALPTYKFAIRQPLSNGQNFIEYLKCFNDIYNLLFIQENHPDINPEFYKFIKQIIKVEDGTSFLKEFFEVALICHVHRFGTKQLIECAYWLFRYTYSPRLTNKRTVREDSIPSYIKNQNKYVFDHILTVFTPSELIHYLKKHDYMIDEDNCMGNTVKNRFIGRVGNYFDFPKDGLFADNKSIKTYFDNRLKTAINDKCINNQ